MIVLLSGNGSTLQALINADLPIKAVFSDNADAYGLIRASNADIETFVHSSTYELTTQIESLGLSPRLVVLAGYMKILPKTFVELYRTVNVHPSLLPLYRGLHTHQRVYEDRCEYHGFTIHWATPKLDDGPIIFQAKFKVGPEDDATSLENTVKALEQSCYPIIVKNLLNEYTT